MNKTTLEDFKENYPGYELSGIKVMKCDEIDVDRILITMSDGHVYFYDRLLNEPKPMNIMFFEDVDELDDEDWRDGIIYLIEREIYLSNMSKREVAEISGIKPMRLYNILNKMAMPTAVEFMKIACALDCDLNDLIPRDYIPYD